RGVKGPELHRLRVSRLEDESWSAPATITESDGLVLNWADFPAVARGRGGTLVAHWAERTGGGSYAYDVVLGHSNDGGKSWRRVGTPHDDRTATEHGFVSLIGDGPGVRAFWLDGREMAGEGHDGAHGGGAMTLRTGMAGAAPDLGELLDPRVCDCCGTSAAMTSEGPVVVYRNRDENEVRDIFILRSIKGVWSQPRPVHADGWRVPGCPVNGPSVVARGKRVAVAWYTYAADRPSVRVAFSEDAGETFGAPIEVDGPRGGRVPLGRVHLVLEEDGTALVSWMASEREDASVLLRRVSPRRRLGSPVLITSTRAERGSGFPRLASSGARLFVAFTEPGTPTRVRVARFSKSDVPPASAQAEPQDPQAGAPAVLAVGRPAPAYAAVDLDGKPVSLEGQKGHAVLVNLWATWCEPCRFELPELAALHGRFSAKGLRVVGVSVDAKRTPAEIRDFVTRRKLPYAIWLDPEDRASPAFGVTTLPASFLFDRRGVLVWRRDGTVRAEDPELLAALQRALATPGE
ncbi:MAG TPA: redoxin domain-containing protein, partial [Longimicrobium sp.]|nr:redoxin domain-containing protein [Longimicrobium sp.]